MPEVKLERVWKFYGDYAALRDCTLTVEEGSCCALLGRNGAGKTTLLRILAGLSPFQRGEIRLFGRPPRNEEARRRIGFLGHGIGVYEDLSARENLNFFARVSGVKEVRKVAGHWLEPGRPRSRREHARSPVLTRDEAAAGACPHISAFSATAAARRAVHVTR